MKKNLVLLALGALTFVSCQTQPKEAWTQPLRNCN